MASVAGRFVALGGRLVTLAPSTRKPAIAIARLVPSIMKLVLALPFEGSRYPSLVLQFPSLVIAIARLVVGLPFEGCSRVSERIE